MAALRNDGPEPVGSLLRLNSTRNSRASERIGTSAFYSRQLCLCPFPAYSAFSPATSFPSIKWSETCTTTLILLISVSFETICGGGCNMHFYQRISHFRPGVGPVWSGVVRCCRCGPVRWIVTPGWSDHSWREVKLIQEGTKVLVTRGPVTELHILSQTLNYIIYNRITDLIQKN